MNDPLPTSVRTLLRAAEIGQEAGLNYVYAGNIPGRMGEYESTYCPNCRHKVVKRTGYSIQEYAITFDGNCPNCGTKIPGVWSDGSERVHLHGAGMPRPIY